EQWRANAQRRPRWLERRLVPAVPRIALNILTVWLERGALAARALHVLVVTSRSIGRAAPLAAFRRCFRAGRGWPHPRPQSRSCARRWPDAGRRWRAGSRVGMGPILKQSRRAAAPARPRARLARDAPPDAPGA